MKPIVLSPTVQSVMDVEIWDRYEDEDEDFVFPFLTAALDAKGRLCVPDAHREQVAQELIDLANVYDAIAEGEGSAASSEERTFAKRARNGLGNLARRVIAG